MRTGKCKIKEIDTRPLGRRKAARWPVLLFSLFLIMIAGVAVAAEDSSSGEMKFDEDLKEHLFLAQELLAKGQRDEALIEFKNLTLMAPEYVDGYIAYASALIEAGKYLEATYQLALASRLLPTDREISRLLESIKGKGGVLGYADGFIEYVLAAGDTPGTLAYRLYEDGIRSYVILRENRGISFKEGEKVRLPVDFSPVHGVVHPVRFDRVVLESEKSVAKSVILEEKERMLSPEDGRGFLEIGKQFFEIGMYFKATMDFEVAVSIEKKLKREIPKNMLAKCLEVTSEYVKKKPEDPLGYFYQGFLEYVSENYISAYENFLIAQAKGLESFYLKKMLFHMSEVIKELKPLTKERIDRKVELALAAEKTRDVAHAPLPSDEGPGTKEKLIYECFLARKAIEDAVERYNSEHIIVMDSANFSLKDLVESRYLSEPVECPEGGKFFMNGRLRIECSVHGE